MSDELVHLLDRITDLAAFRTKRTGEKPSVVTLGYRELMTVRKAVNDLTGSTAIGDTKIAGMRIESVKKNSYIGVS